MPMHDWTKVPAGIYHSFHGRWISAIFDVLNDGKLPPDYYALAEQLTGDFGPDVLTLQSKSSDRNDLTNGSGPTTALVSRPQTRFSAQTDQEFHRRKKNSIAIRHISDDSIVAILEIVSPGNKSSRHAFAKFVDKACAVLQNRIHLLIVDPFPPGPRDPNGIHAAIWEQIQDDDFELPEGEPLTLVAYESDLTTRAYIETCAVGKPLPDMPLFLEPDGCIMVPLESTYMTAFQFMPKRWRDVIV